MRRGKKLSGHSTVHVSVLLFFEGQTDNVNNIPSFSNSLLAKKKKNSLFLLVHSLIFKGPTAS